MTRPNYFQRVFHPEWFHGHRRRPPFFEGWYFKLVDAAEEIRYAIIPGIFLSDDPDQHHSFIQVLDGLSGQATYHRYPADTFWAAEDRFDVRVGGSEFSHERIKLKIADEQLTLSGELTFDSLTPWPVRWHSPGIMGPFGWLPGMECNHGVVSLDHSLHGSLQINANLVDFSGGRGYIEKDWGAAFPAGYIWTQSNHFESPGTSFMGSIAIIPYAGITFPGFLSGLWHAGRLWRFATYTGARTRHLGVDDTHIEWVIGDRKHELALRATRQRGGLLLGPTRESMGTRVGETMLATLELSLKEGKSTIFEGCGQHGGLEAHGDLERLLSLHKGDVLTRPKTEGDVYV